MARPDHMLKADELNQFRDLIRQRHKGCPVAYLTGKQDFWNHSFLVSTEVLIPRPDTEVLVEEALKRLSSLREKPLRILDIGTGSGCIAISLALECPQAEVEAWDISDSALEVAKQNQKALGSRVHFCRKDALNPDFWQNTGPFDLIVSNPPYIAEEEKKHLGPGVLTYEPHQALFATEHGLAFYYALARQAFRVLRPGHGCIMVETGYRQGEAVQEIFRKGPWKNSTIVRDLSGLNRVVTADRIT